MCDCSEPGLASQSAEVVRDLNSVELPPIIEDHHTRDVEACDDALLNEFTYFAAVMEATASTSIHSDEEVLALPYGLRKRP